MGRRSAKNAAVELADSAIRLAGETVVMADREK